MNFIDRYISLYRLACYNFKTWHSKLDDEKIISKFYNKYYGLSTMNYMFVKDYKEGINKAFKDKEKYGIFKKVIKNIYTGNVYNNPYTICNLFSITSSLFSFEDCIVNNTAGGTIFGLYESANLLMIYNNIDFGSGYIEPSLEQLYMLGRDLIGRIYSTMRRLYVDLNYNGNLINNKESIDTFINNSINQFYIITNNTIYNDNIQKLYKYIMNNNELYSFVSIFGQFMDYDFIASQVLKLLTNKQFSLFKKEDIVKYINNVISNSGNNIALYKYYTESIDKIDNQLNNIINKIIERKQGTIVNNNIIDYNKEEIDKRIVEIEDTKKNIHSNYPIDINDSCNISNININKVLSTYITYDSIGITEEEYKELDNIKKEEIDKIKNNIENIEIDYNKEITEIELKLSQLKRAKLIKDGIEVYDNSEKEFYSMISKGKDPNLLLFEKLDSIDKKISSIKEILLDNNHMLKTLLNSKDSNDTTTIDTIIVDKEKDNNVKEDEVSIIEDDTELTFNGQIFSNKLADYSYYISLPDIIDNNQYALPPMPIENEDKSIIQFYSNLGERCTVIKDLRDYKEIDINSIDSSIKEYYHNYYKTQKSSSVNESILYSDYPIKDNKEVAYNSYLYIPESYLEEYIPFYINPNCKVNVNKAILQDIPLYINDLNKLLLVFYNIPISFNQKYEYIIKAILERIEPVSERMSNKIIEEMNNIELSEYWDRDNITLNCRMVILENLYNTVMGRN